MKLKWNPSALFSRRSALAGLAAAGGPLAAAPRPSTKPLHGPVFDVRDFGAVPDGRTKNTKQIQSAIDACAAAGRGAVVLIPPGDFLSGSLRLRSGITLHVAAGATLRGSTDPADYPPYSSGWLGDITFGKPVSGYGFLAANGVDGLVIEGRGVIHGNGDNTKFDTRDNKPGRPFLLHLMDSKNILVQDVTLRNSVFWTSFFQKCDGVRLLRLYVDSRVAYNNDGIDIEADNVLVDGCTIDTDDDAICLKSHDSQVMRNIVIANCNIGTSCNGIKTGTASLGGFRNLTVTNCVIHQASSDKQRKWSERYPGVDEAVTGFQAIALEVNDGGLMERVAISNVAINNFLAPIFVRLGNRGAGAGRPVGRLRDVLIQNVVASGHSRWCSNITGVPGHPVENVHLSNIHLDCRGGGTREDAERVVPEPPNAAYPESHMFGNSLPGYGLYARHVNGLYLSDVTMRLRNPDARPAIVLDDVSRDSLAQVFCDPSSSGVESIVRKG